MCTWREQSMFVIYSDADKNNVIAAFAEEQEFRDYLDQHPEFRFFCCGNTKVRHALN